MIWLAGIPLAWPDPARMLAVSLIGGLLFTAVGLRYAIPPAHVLAAASLSLAGLLATHCPVAARSAGRKVILAWSPAFWPPLPVA